MDELTNSGNLPRKHPLFAHLSAPYQLAVALSLVVMGILSFNVIGIFVSFLLFGIEDIQHLTLNFSQHLTDPATINTLKLVQAFSAIGGFIVPALIFAQLVSGKFANYLKLNQLPYFKLLPITVLLTLCIGPLINFFAEINSHLHLPDYMAGIEQWMRDSEDEAARITTAFLKMDNLWDLVINLIIVGLLAALGEELLFRGVIQTIFKKWTNNPHIAIWLSAILFSAFHLQFYGFLPRMLLGALLGYLFHWSNSIWLPVLAHFTNNATAVLVTYFITKPELLSDVETVGKSRADWLILIVSALSMIVILKYMYHICQHKTDPSYHSSTYT